MFSVQNRVAAEADRLPSHNRKIPEIFNQCAWSWWFRSCMYFLMCEIFFHWHITATLFAKAHLKMSLHCRNQIKTCRDHRHPKWQVSVLMVETSFCRDYTRLKNLICRFHWEVQSLKHCCWFSDCENAILVLLVFFFH